MGWRRCGLGRRRRGLGWDGDGVGWAETATAWNGLGDQSLRGERDESLREMRVHGEI